MQRERMEDKLKLPEESLKRIEEHLERLEARFEERVKSMEDRVRRIAAIIGVLALFIVYMIYRGWVQP
jgi:hypothetical protein